MLIMLDKHQLQREMCATGASTSTEKGHVLSEEEMEEIWSDIQSMVTPSWMVSVPSNLGSPDHGKLKADQWRALGTIYFPISLIRLWRMNRIEKRSWAEMPRNPRHDHFPSLCRHHRLVTYHINGECRRLLLTHASLSQRHQASVS